MTEERCRRQMTEVRCRGREMQEGMRMRIAWRLRQNPAFQGHLRHAELESVAWQRARVLLRSAINFEVSETLSTDKKHSKALEFCCHQWKAIGLVKAEFFKVLWLYAEWAMKRCTELRLPLWSRRETVIVSWCFSLTWNVGRGVLLFGICIWRWTMWNRTCAPQPSNQVMAIFLQLTN